MFRSMARAIIPLAVVATTFSFAQAQELKINEVASVVKLNLAELKPNMIAFNDHRKDELVDPNSGLIKFEDWARTYPLQKGMLSLYPSYTEPKITITVDGATKPFTQRLS